MRGPTGLLDSIYTVGSYRVDRSTGFFHTFPRVFFYLYRKYTYTGKTQVRSVAKKYPIGHDHIASHTSLKLNVSKFLTNITKIIRGKDTIKMS